MLLIHLLCSWRNRSTHLVGKYMQPSEYGHLRRGPLAGNLGSESKEIKDKVTFSKSEN